MAILQTLSCPPSVQHPPKILVYLIFRFPEDMKKLISYPIKTKIPICHISLQSHFPQG